MSKLLFLHILILVKYFFCLNQSSNILHLQHNSKKYKNNKLSNSKKKVGME